MSDALDQQRLHELESRLSLDVAYHGLSQRLRRLMVVGVAVAVASLIGSGIALGEDVHVNERLTQNDALRSRQIESIMDAIQNNAAARDAQMEKILKQIQATNTRISDNSAKRDAQLEALLGRVRTAERQIAQIKRTFSK